MKKSNSIVTKNASELAKALGLSSSDAVEWEVRHSVTKKIISIVEKKSFTITLLAKESGTSRARVTKILKGETSGISLDVLFRVLGATGQKVKLSFKKAA